MFQDSLRNAAGADEGERGGLKAEEVYEICERILRLADAKLHRKFDTRWLLHLMRLDESTRLKVLNHVRTHGTQWHLQDILSNLQSAIEGAASDAVLSDSQQRDLLSFPVVSLCDPRYQKQARQVERLLFPSAASPFKRWLLR